MSGGRNWSPTARPGCSDCSRCAGPSRPADERATVVRLLPPAPMGRASGAGQEKPLQLARRNRSASPAARSGSRKWLSEARSTGGISLPAPACNPNFSHFSTMRPGSERARRRSLRKQATWTTGLRRDVRAWCSTRKAESFRAPLRLADQRCSVSRMIGCSRCGLPLESCLTLATMQLAFQASGAAAPATQRADRVQPV